LGIDGGRTFTDGVLIDDRSGRIHYAKVLTTPSDPTAGVSNGIEKILAATGNTMARSRQDESADCRLRNSSFLPGRGHMPATYTSPFIDNGPSLEGRVSPSRAAVIVVDIQNDMCHPEGALAKMGTDMRPILDTVANIKVLVDEAHRLSIPVIFTQLTFDELTMPPAVRQQREKNGDRELCIKGTWGADIFEFEQGPNDRIVEKHRYDAFFETELDMVLKSLERDSLIITGIASNVCAQATGIGGYQRGYYVTFLADCTSTYSDKAHQEALAYADRFLGKVADSSEILEIWREMEPLPQEV